MARNCPHCGFPDEGGVGYCLVCGEPFYVPQQPQTTTKKNKTKKSPPKLKNFIALILILIIFMVAKATLDGVTEKPVEGPTEYNTEYESDRYTHEEVTDHEEYQDPYWQDTADVSEQEIADVKAEIIKYAESQGYENINVVSLTVIQMPASNYNREIKSSYKAPEDSDVFIADFFIDGVKDGLLHVLDGDSVITRADGKYKHISTEFTNDIY